ncbi:2-methoxy-6-polyprenyl-1,4-benzoquinol methylase, mitochondrial [Methanosarcinaceae archaeon Ag5]|uniref:2-methoxy-6-polyprenyl-1,4-benzoquinol methylase, mitochondrial n=1 Tax=Methanolapillus africanus TaxID=3028297 RepID=A0AAE4MID7_9EURY|nr:2-methoxy-6-polyprenyl-1,4-benzoquinol methylase, mitochondrial [Methanosarcinaceae archaeon Ag5]
MTELDNGKSNSSPKFPPAGGYDNNVRFTVPNYDLFHAQTLRLVKAYFENSPETKNQKKEPVRWLDAGCGTGTLAQKIVEKYPETEIFLADPSPEMIKMAQQKLNEIGKTQIQYLKTKSTQELDFPDNAFDVVTAVLSHHYLSEKDRKTATENCFRMLKPDGIYITFEHTAPVTETGKMLAQQMVADFQTEHGKSETDAENYRQRYGTEYFPITAAQHIDLLKKAGFKTVELFWYSYLDAGFYAVKE